MIQMDDTAFDDALNDPYFTLDTCNITYNHIKAAIIRGFFCPTCAKATVYGRLLSTDILGPYAQIGRTQHVMAYWYHDHATKYALLFHYQTGNELAIEHLQSLVQTEFSGDTKLIAYHADSGKNLINKKTRDLFTANGTTFTWSPAYKQSMNGSAERLIGIIDTSAACLLYESGRLLMCRGSL